MSYIDPIAYSKILKAFAKGSPKSILRESTDIKNPGKYKQKSYDLDGDGVPNKADKAPKDGSIQELSKPKHNLKNLSIDERKQLGEYINSVKEIKSAIGKLMEKAKMQEGGDMTNLNLALEDDDTSGEDDAVIDKYQAEKDQEDAVAGSTY